jgi:hypothetical protein
MSASVGKKFNQNDPKTFGQRPDGSQKGSGYFGVLKRPDGGVSTEISIGVGLNGKETDIPLIVPTLTKQELNMLLKMPLGKGFNPPESIIKKAVDHAQNRIQAGKSPFAGPDEQMGMPK